MIHYEFRKLWDAAPGEPAPDAAEVWAKVQAHVRAENGPTAALLQTQASLELDAEKRHVTLVLHPGLYHLVTRQPERRAVIERAVQAVLGYGWSWSAVAGSWRHEGGEIRLEPFTPLTARDRGPVEEEAHGLAQLHAE